jgi:hypothetical protein
MIRLLIITIFALLALPLQAHEEPGADLTQSSGKGFELRADSIEIVTDSLTAKERRKLDRLQTRRKKVQEKLAKLNPQRKATELNQRAQYKLDSLNPINKVNSLTARVDSIRLEKKISRFDHQLDSLHGRLTSKIDSLTRLPNPDQILIKNLDSLRSGPDSLKASGLMEELHQIKQKGAQAQTKVSERLNTWQQKIQAKLSPLQENGVNTEGVGLPAVSLPAAGLNIPDVPSTLSLPSTGIHTDLGVTLPGTNLPKGKIPGNSGLPNIHTPETSLPGLGESNKKLGSITGVSTQINGYAKDAQALASGNGDKLEQLPQKLEENVSELDVLKDAQKELTESMDYAEMMKKWNSDPAVAKELALNKAKEGAMSHFAGHEEELKAAMEQLAKLKAKKPDAEGVIDLFKPKQNDLKGRPFRERLVPGLSLQFQNSTNQWFDFNLYLGYRISGRFTAGAGWVERLSYNFDKWEWHPDERAYGVRLYAEMKVKKGFHLRAEAERVYAFVRRPLLNSPDITGPLWVTSYFAGVKQSFNYSPSVRGNTQLLYNVYDPDKQSPYVNRIQVRIGIELPYKKIK